MRLGARLAALRAVEKMADESEPLASATIFSDYEEWVSIYDIVKETALISEGVEFCRSHPGTVNNRKQSVRGNSLLHQAGFWGATTVLHAFKELGADPTLRNFEGKTPAEMARNASKKAEFEAAITEVFGADDAASRRELLVAAKNGDFIEALTLLNSKPHLINTQSHVSGWSVLHQAAFHGCSHALIKRLLVNGACTRLKGYYDGKTALAVLEERHPDHPAIADLRAQGAPTSHAQALTPGDRVSCFDASSSVMVRGTVRSLDAAAGTVAVSTDSGEHTFPTWRTWAVSGAAAFDDDAAEAACPTCYICYSNPTATIAKLSPSCIEPPHPLCYECTALSLWAEHTSLNYPMRCKFPGCNATVDLNGPLFSGRGAARCWPPGGVQTSLTTLDAFLGVARQKTLEVGERVQDVASFLRILAEAPPTLQPIAYCNLRGCPSKRACPACGVIIEYESACKHFNCALCHHRFCFICLKSESQHAQGKWSISFSCEIAPVQTQLPSLPTIE